MHVANIAELVGLAALKPGARVLNAGDPEAPSVGEIAASISALLDRDGETVLIDAPSPAPVAGSTPWSIDRPVALDMSAAERELGYRAVTGCADSLRATVSWLGPDWTAATGARHS